MGSILVSISLCACTMMRKKPSYHKKKTPAQWIKKLDVLLDNTSFQVYTARRARNAAARRCICGAYRARVGTVRSADRSAFRQCRRPVDASPARIYATRSIIALIASRKFKLACFSWLTSPSHLSCKPTMGYAKPKQGPLYIGARSAAIACAIGRRRVLMWHVVKGGGLRTALRRMCDIWI